MGFKVETIAKPAPTNSGEQQTSAAAQARAKAIAMLTGNQAQATPVANPSNISAEEMQGTNAAPKQTLETAVAESQGDPSEAVTQPDKEEPLSTQYAALARKEKALRANVLRQEQTFKQREQALAQREAEIARQPSTSQVDPTKFVSIEELKRNAYGVLQKNGINYDQISTQALNAESPEFQEIQRVANEMREEIKQLREEAGTSRKTFEEQQTQAYQQAVGQIREEASQLVDSDPEFEMTKTTNSVDDVVELITRTHKETGKLLTVEQAARAIEEDLLAEVDKISATKKFQARLASAKSPSAQTKQPNSQAAPQMKTLTNDVQSTRPLNARERALLAFSGGQTK